MNAFRDARARSRGPIRMAVIVAALAVAGCFTAAATFTETPAQAATATDSE